MTILLTILIVASLILLTTLLVTGIYLAINAISSIVFKSNFSMKKRYIFLIVGFVLLFVSWYNFPITTLIITVPVVFLFLLYWFFSAIALLFLMITDRVPKDW